MSARIAAACLLAVVLASCSGGTPSCEVCGRACNAGIRFEAELRDGRHLRFCCPMCASHAVAGEGGLEKVARLTAHDFETGDRLDARSAVYVVGSDVNPCRAPEVVREKEGCCATLAMDRCSPSVLAFRDRGAAEAFAGAHGGTVKVFDDLRFGES